LNSENLTRDQLILKELLAETWRGDDLLEYTNLVDKVDFWGVVLLGSIIIFI
jgi:hypothetical protein